MTSSRFSGQPTGANDIVPGGTVLRINAVSIFSADQQVSSSPYAVIGWFLTGRLGCLAYRASADGGKS